MAVSPVIAARFVFTALGLFMLATLLYTIITDGSPFHRELLTPKHIVSVSKRTKSEACLKVAFRTMSDVEIMDDEYRWRKYGKKSVKNSPNPRNYYRCSNADCTVKKRVERDRDDSRFVITT